MTEKPPDKKKGVNVPSRELKAGSRDGDGVMIPDKDFFKTVVSDERLQRREFKAAPSHKPLEGISTLRKRTRDAERSSLDASLYLGKAEELRALIESGQTADKSEIEVAAMLDIIPSRMHLVRGLMNLDDAVKLLVANGSIGVDIGGRIGSYPRGLHVLFANSLENGSLTAQDFTSYGRIRAGRHKPASLKARVEGVGLVWPDGVEDEIGDIGDKDPRAGK